MSFDIWLSSFRSGELFYYPQAIVNEAFQKYVDRWEGDALYIVLPDGWRVRVATDLDDVCPGAISSIAVNRPPDTREFWEGLIEIMRRTPSVLYWPGLNPCGVVTTPEVIKECPDSFIEAVGIPVLISTVEEIDECLRRSA